MKLNVFIWTVFVASILGILLGYYRGLPDDFDGIPDVADFGYRCGDGSEFTVEPTADMKAITLIPSTSSDYLQKTTLTLVGGDVYVGGGITFAPHGTSGDLTSASSAATTCMSMNPAGKTLFQK